MTENPGFRFLSKSGDPVMVIGPFSYALIPHIRT